MTTSIAYTKPQLVDTGQILSRAYLSTLSDNDEYFWGLARRWQCVPLAVHKDWVQQSVAERVWDGHILYPAKPDDSTASDATTLHYWIQSGTTDVTTRLYIGDPDDWAATSEQIAAANNTTVTGEYDMTAKPWTPGTLLRVYCYADCTGIVSGTDVASCRTPYLTYTSSDFQYVTNAALTDGDLSHAIWFNNLRGNDLYFNECRPRQPAFAGMKRTYIAAEDELEIWRGYIPHRFHTLNYLALLYVSGGVLGTNTVTITYDDGGPNDTHIHLTSSSADEVEGSFTINEAGGQVGVWKPITVTMERDAAETIAPTGGIFYIYMSPEATIDAAEHYVPMPEFRANQWVYGNHPADRTSLDWMRRADLDIFETMCQNATVGRRDYAVPKPYYYRLGNTEAENLPGDDGEYRLVRRYDTLYYRTLGAKMTWGGGANSYSLTDYDSDNPYRTLDLKGLDTLNYGQVYRIVSSDDDENLQYAMEM